VQLAARKYGFRRLGYSLSTGGAVFGGEFLLRDVVSLHRTPLSRQGLQRFGRARTAFRQTGDW